MKVEKNLVLPMVLAVVACLIVAAPGIGAQIMSGKAPLKEEAADNGEELEKIPPSAPIQAPAYLPLASPPYPASSLELSSISGTMGPVTGGLAPYGNTAAQESLLRGWNMHKLGVFTVAPFLEYDGIYRSNVFSTPADKKSDFVNAVNPGLRLELPLARRHKISLGYLGNYFIFSRFSNLSHYDHNVNADASFNFPGGLSIRLGNGFRAATEEPSAENARKRPFLRNTPYLQAGYSLADKWRLQGFYQFDLLNFRDAVDRVNDYQEHAAGMTFYYKFWPKTAALAQYIFISRRFPDSPRDDKIINSPLLGLTWDPSSKISATAKFGYSFVDYSQKRPGRDNSPGSFIMSLQTLYRYSRYTNLALTVQRSKQDDVDFGNSPFWNTGVFATYSHDWHYFRMTTYASFGFINNDYLNESFDSGSGSFKGREDNIIYLGAGLSRPLTRWLKVRLDYSYFNQSSNISGFTYNEHQALFGLQTSL